VVSAECRKAGIPVHFSTDLQKDLPRAWLFVYITELEGLGSAALLAMAHGLPVLASDIGGLPAEIDRLRKANESVGGVFGGRAFGLVPGLGSHVFWEERLDGRLGQAMLSIQAIKGVSLGDGFEVAGLPGSQAHDEIFHDERRGYYRSTNRAGTRSLARSASGAKLG